MLKHLLAWCALLAVIFGTSRGYASDHLATLRVRNMPCALCPLIVQRTIETIAGITKIFVSTENGTATIIYNDRATSPTEFAETVANAGYPAWPMKK